METTNLKETSAVMELSKLSMGIYIIHHILIEELLSVSTIRNLMDGYWLIGPFVLFAVVFSCSYLIARLLHSNKYLSKFI